MTKLRAKWAIGLEFCGALLVAQIAGAQTRAAIIACLKELN
jgi:hypothetical protein